MKTSSPFSKHFHCRKTSSNRKTLVGTPVSRQGVRGSSASTRVQSPSSQRPVVSRQVTKVTKCQNRVWVQLFLSLQDVQFHFLITQFPENFFPVFNAYFILVKYLWSVKQLHRQSRSGTAQRSSQGRVGTRARAYIISSFARHLMVSSTTYFAWRLLPRFQVFFCLRSYWRSSFKSFCISSTYILLFGLFTGQDASGTEGV